MAFNFLFKQVDLKWVGWTIVVIATVAIWAFLSTVFTIKFIHFLPIPALLVFLALAIYGFIVALFIHTKLGIAVVVAISLLPLFYVSTRWLNFGVNDAVNVVRNFNDWRFFGSIFVLLLTFGGLPGNLLSSIIGYFAGRVLRRLVFRIFAARMRV
jgi:hypothetical protein